MHLKSTNMGEPAKFWAHKDERALILSVVFLAFRAWQSVLSGVTKAILDSLSVVYLQYTNETFH